MNMQILSNLHLLARTKPRVAVTPGRLETFPFQEQFTGPLPQRYERQTAEVLAERLAKSGPDGAPPVFIP